MNKEHLFDIGKFEGLKHGHLSAFVHFFKKRFPDNKDNYYAGEWAKRFYDGNMFAIAEQIQSMKKC